MHDDVIKWKHFPRYWPFVREIHRSPVTRSFDVFFDLRLNKRLRKQSWRWWFETPSSPLWRHCNGRQCKRCDFIANPCPIFNGGLTKPSLKFEYGWIDTSHPWWCHQMETFSMFLAICARNSPVHGEFPAQRPVTRSFDVPFDLRLN